MTSPHYQWYLIFCSALTILWICRIYSCIVAHELLGFPIRTGTLICPIYHHILLYRLTTWTGTHKIKWHWRWKCHWAWRLIIFFLISPLALMILNHCSLLERWCIWARTATSPRTDLVLNLLTTARDWWWDLGQLFNPFDSRFVFLGTWRDSHSSRPPGLMKSQQRCRSHGNLELIPFMCLALC